MPNFDSFINQDFIQISIIRDDTFEGNHQQCHQKSYYGDINNHMTLNTIFRVVFVWTDVDEIQEMDEELEKAHPTHVHIKKLI